MNAIYNNTLLGFVVASNTSMMSLSDVQIYFYPDMLADNVSLLFTPRGALQRGA